MKRVLSILVVCLLVAALLPAGVMAADASASLTGPDVVRAGDTITLTFTVSGVGMLAVSGTLEYDQDQLQYVGTKKLISDPWEVEFNGNKMVAYDNKLTNPINSAKQLFSVTFKVRSLDVGTEINVSYKDVITSDGQADTQVGVVSYKATVAAPLSTDNKLGSLRVNNATLTPAFRSDITSYTASVPFEVSQLDLKAYAANEKAKVEITNPQLTPNGTTNVIITVTAENGNKRTYTIAVTRAQDPNYQASGNNYLKDILVEGFLISPEFDPEMTEYLVWLPYEVGSIHVSGITADERATVRIEGGYDLLPGQDNRVQVICVAENGQEKVYTLIVKRAAAHGAEPSVPPATQPSIPEQTQPTTQPTTAPSTAPSTTQPPVTQPVQQGGSPWWVSLIVGLVALAAGTCAGFFLSDKIKELLNME